MFQCETGGAAASLLNPQEGLKPPPCCLIFTVFTHLNPCREQLPPSAQPQVSEMLSDCLLTIFAWFTPSHCREVAGGGPWKTCLYKEGISAEKNISGVF